MAAKNSDIKRECVHYGSSICVDSSALYDLFFTLNAVATPTHYARWRQWGTMVRDAYNEREMQRLRRWFGSKFSLGAAFLTLIPLLGEPVRPGDLLDAIAELPMGDFLRIVVTVEYTNPETPLDAETLLGLSRNADDAQVFLGRYLGLSGRTRTDVLRVLADPEGARADLLALLRHHLALPQFTEFIEETREERERALEALRGQVGGGVASVPAWLIGSASIEGFAQVVLAVSVVLDTGRFGYIQEIARSLLDSTSYEPLILISGARLVLDGPTAGRRGAEKGALPRDPVERAARVFSLLGDPSRLRLLRLLAQRPHFGLELAAALDVTPASVSQQVGMLASAGLVRAERRAHRTYYMLQRDALAAALASGQTFLEEGLAHDEGKDAAQ